MQSTIILRHESLIAGDIVTVKESLILMGRPHHVVEHPILKIDVAVPASKMTCPKIARSHVESN